MEHALKDKERQGHQEDAAVKHTAVHHAGIGTEEDGDALQKHQAYPAENHTRHKTGHHEHGEDAVGFASVALAKGLGHQSASTRAQYRAYHANQEQERHHQVNGGEGRFAHKVGHEHTVNHAINRGENHHGDGRQREAQQLAVAEMVGEGDGGHGGFIRGRKNTK